MALTVAPARRLAVRTEAAVKPPQVSSLCFWHCTCGSTLIQPETSMAAARVLIHLVQGVTLPPKKPVEVPSTFGFVYNAERLNSRAAMVSP